MLFAGQVALGVDERLERRLCSCPADHPEVTVDLVGVRKLLDEGGVVGGAERGEHAGDDVAADTAEVSDETSRRGVAEAVVVGDDRDRVPTLLVVQDVAHAGVPDGAVTVEAEVVLRLHLQRGLLRAGDPGQDGQLGVGLRRRKAVAAGGQRVGQPVDGHLLDGTTGGNRGGQQQG